MTLKFFWKNRKKSPDFQFVGNVFLSYRQENFKYPDHKERVRKFALKLRSALHNSELMVVLDQLANEKEFNRGGPPIGWMMWSYQQVEQAEKVLIIGSPGYYQVYEDKATAGIGIGAAIEARRIFLRIAKSKGYNNSYRIVILGEGDDEGIPDQLADYHRFYPNRILSDFDDLVCWLKGNTSRVDTENAKPLVWPKMLDSYEPEIANRLREFSFSKKVLGNKVFERAVFFKAESNHGKTTLIRECKKYARQVIGESAVALVDFKNSSSREALFDTLRLKLGRELPNFSKTGAMSGDLRRDLRALSQPTVLLFDSFEKADSEARELVGFLLADMEEMPAVRIFVAGQQIPDYAKAVWSSFVRCFDLGPICDVGAWEVYAKKKHPRLCLDQVKTLAEAAWGVPGNVTALLVSLETFPGK